MCVRFRLLRPLLLLLTRPLLQAGLAMDPLRFLQLLLARPLLLN